MIDLRLMLYSFGSSEALAPGGNMLLNRGALNPGQGRGAGDDEPHHGSSRLDMQVRPSNRESSGPLKNSNEPVYDLTEWNLLRHG